MPIAPPPLTLADHVRMAAETVQRLRRKKVQVANDEAFALDQLARLEAQAVHKAPGWEQVELSGLVPQNPYVVPASNTPNDAPTEEEN